MTYVNVTKDGAFIAGPFNENQAFSFLLRYQSKSVDAAIADEGYAFEPTDDAPSMAVENILVGKLANGDRVYVDVELKRRDGAGKRTVTHETAPAEYLEFSASGLLVEPRRRMENAYSAGQCLDALTEIVKPADGLTLDDVKKLHRLWKAWHLNGMHGGCQHVPVPEYRKNERYGYQEIDLDATPVCPETGYRYGSAWLVAPIPATVVDDMQTMIRKLLSTAK